MVNCVVHFLRLLAVWWPGAQSAWDNHLFFLVTLPNIHRVKKNSLTDSAINLSQICYWQPHYTLNTFLHYFFNVLLIACFLTLVFHKVMWQVQGAVKNFNNHFTANLQRNFLAKKFKIGWDLTELQPWDCGLSFFRPPCSRPIYDTCQATLSISYDA